MYSQAVNDKIFEALDNEFEIKFNQNVLGANKNIDRLF
jgi:hypothetical protein